jgi:hypothetical protein
MKKIYFFVYLLIEAIVWMFVNFKSLLRYPLTTAAYISIVAEILVNSTLTFIYLRFIRKGHYSPKILEIVIAPICIFAASMFVLGVGMILIFVLESIFKGPIRLD